jgi:site-specific DNA recombinase
MDTSQPLRALLAVRLSRLSDDTTSPERQLREGKTYITGRGWTFVDVAEDLDVSARTTGPFDRHFLGDWLRNRADEFDVIVFWRLDRIVRSVADLAELLRWAKQHGKHLASVTEEHFDTSTPIGYIIAILIAWVAEMESQATSERTSAMHADFIDDGRYRGGPPSWGYRPVLITDSCWVCDNAGTPCRHVGQKRLEPDPVMGALAQQVAARIIDDKERPMVIVKDLTARGILTPDDYWRTTYLTDRHGKPRKAKGTAWDVGNLVAMLRSPALMGYQVKRDVLGVDQNGKKIYGKPEIVRDEDGNPVQRAQPILDPVTWATLQQRLDDMNDKRGPYTGTTAVLLGVLTCGVCGKNMYHNGGRNAVYYRCRSYSTGRPCGNKSIREDIAVGFLTELLLGEFGDLERCVKVFVPGEDHAAELEQIRLTLDDLTTLLTKPAYRTGTKQRERLDRHIERLAEREARLEAMPARPARYRLDGTGQTFREYWDSLDVHDKNVYLRDNGVTVTFAGDSKNPEWSFELANLRDILGSIDPGIDAAEYQEQQQRQARRARESIGA